MALTLEDCRSMIDAARQAGVRLVVGHSHSFDLPIARTAELAKAYGPVRMITALDYTDWVYRPRRPEEPPRRCRTRRRTRSASRAGSPALV